MRRFPWIIYIIVLILFVLVSQVESNPVARTKTNEIRGVWITNVASGVMYLPWGINRAIAQLNKLNFNTLYPVVWNRGYTFYPSQVAFEQMGAKVDPLLKFVRWGDDILQEIIKQGHKRDMRVIPWFEYGLMTPVNSELALRHPDWITQSRKGQRVLGNSFETEALDHQVTKPNLWTEIQQAVSIKQVWLNPLHPEVKKFLTNLIVEVVTNYNVDGIQLDDHFGFPVELGYDPYTIREYQRTHEGRRPPDNPMDPEWMTWRANKLTVLMREIYRAVKKVKPNVKVTISPNPINKAYRYYLQHWLSWVNLGIVDELVIQVYRKDLDDFILQLEDQGVMLARKKIPVSIGILTGTLRSPVEIKQINRQIKEVRSHNLSGVSFFYWETLWSYFTPDSPQVRRRSFQNLFKQ